MTDTAITTDTAEEFDLTPPAPVAKVSREQATSAKTLQLNQEEQTKVQKTAQEFVSAQGQIPAKSASGQTPRLLSLKKEQ